jgi:hypothetical protein
MFGSRFLRRKVHCGSKEEALRCAREFCDREGISWNEPVSVRRSLRHWVVWTMHGYTAGNVEILVNIKTGKVWKRRGPLNRR